DHTSRGGEDAPPRGLLQGAPVVPVEGRRRAPEARSRLRRRGTEERELRRRRQLVEAPQPVPAVALVAAPRPQPPLREDVVAEGELELRPGTLRLEVAPVQLVE